MQRINRTPIFTVHLDRLEHNLSVLCSHSHCSADRIIAVVKDNGYGIGALAMAQTLQNKGVQHFGVAALDEALFLREKGIGGSIILLGFSDQSQFEVAIEKQISFSIIDPVQFEPFARIHRTPEIHLLVDTGMHRNGIRHDEILSGKYDSFFEKLHGKIVGLYTHYHSSDQTDQQSVLEQHDRFNQVKCYLANLNVNPKFVHCSNSGAVLYGTVASDEMARFGIAFHGVGKDVCPDLLELSEIHSVVTAIRTVYAGEGISYNHLYAPSVDTKVATIPIGYGDGYSRSFTGKSWAIINGRKYPILARVTMDYILVDIGDDVVSIGDTATLLGENGAESISVVELARTIGTIPYEILCTCGAGMDHRYVRHGNTISTINRNLF